MRILYLLLALCVTSASYAQELQILKKIGIDNPNSDSGLAQTFEGDVLNDGQLYFKASYNGWKEEIWKTDGTFEGTVKLFEEGDIGNWSDFYFTGDGIIIETSGNPGKLIFYDISDQSFTDLVTLPDLYVREFKEYGDKYMMLIRNANDTAELWVTDKTSAGTFKLGEVGEFHVFMELYCSPSGAVVYNSNSFVDYEPVFYNAQTDEVVEVVEYLSPFDSVDQVNDIFIYENLLLLNGRYDNYFRNYIFNIETETFYPFRYLRDVKLFMPYEDDVLIITKTQIIRLDLSDYTYEQLNGDVDPFSNFYLDGDILYFIRENDNLERELCTLNLSTQHVAELENSNFNMFLDCKLVKYKGEFYFTSKIELSTYLMKYDHEQKKGILVDTIAFENGSYTIENALEVVGDYLITSVYNREIGHELYYLSASSNSLVNLRAAKSLEVFPNPTKAVIRIDELKPQPYEIIIYNHLGKKLNHGTYTTDEIDVTGFPAGVYHGFIMQGAETYTIKFVKS